MRVAERTAVDPVFLFDIAERASEDTIFAQTTSDEFFAELPAAKQYDLIFIDGLHTFEQTYRDLCNCLLHSHWRTPILIDDTLPSDVYSSLRDPGQTQAFRDAARSESSAWHGDTFKVVFAIHDFHLGLDYRTIVGFRESADARVSPPQGLVAWHVLHIGEAGGALFTGDPGAVRGEADGVIPAAEHH